MDRSTPYTNIPLPTWLSPKERKHIEKEGQREKNNLRKFILIIMKQDFVKMSQFVNSLDVPLTSMIWKTFHEFRDEERNQNRYRCLRCRMIMTTCVTRVADQLKSADIISDSLYEDVIDTKLKVGAQEALWDKVLEECKL